jgi:hypothetical protein
MASSSEAGMMPLTNAAYSNCKECTVFVLIEVQQELCSILNTSVTNINLTFGKITYLGVKQYFQHDNNQRDTHKSLELLSDK